jgi:hypothetical protein
MKTLKTADDKIVNLFLYKKISKSFIFKVSSSISSDNMMKLLHNFKTAQEYVKLGKFIEFFDSQKPKSLSLSKDKDKIMEILRSQGIEIED